MLTTFVVSEPELTLKLDGIKGQLISKCLFGVFNPPKKRTKTIQLEVINLNFFCSLFGRIEDGKKTYQIN